MKILAPIRRYSVALLAYLGDTAHRRAIATGIAMLATHALGKALDAEVVAIYLDLAIGIFGGAWSSRTPALDEVSK